NRDWDDSWGGALELWDSTKSQCRERIMPIFNRMVVFTISGTAYHGHPDPLNCPDGQSRKSIALYYFTVEAPPDVPGLTGSSRPTTFVKRPGETVPIGTVFTRDRWSGINGTSPAPASRGLATLGRRAVVELTPPVLMRAVRSQRRRRRAPSP